MRPLLLILLLTLPLLPMQHVGADVPTEDCPLATSTQQTYSAWRNTSNEGANRVQLSIRLFNLDCLRGVINIGIPMLRFPSLASILGSLGGRLCQLILNSVTAVEPALRRSPVERIAFDRPRPRPALA